MKLFLIILVMTMVVIPLVAQNSEEQSIQQLQDKILRQQQILQNLEQQIQSREQINQAYTENLVNEYLQQPFTEESEGITAGYEKGFFINSEDGDFQMKINGYLRGHLFFYEAHTYNNNSFRMSESRVDFHFYLFKDWHIRIRPDFAVQDGNMLRDTYLEYLGWDCLRARIGAWITNFSIEAETNPPDLLAIFYSPYNSAIPNRDVGVSIFGYGIPFVKSEYLADHFFYSLGVFNGNGLNSLDNNDRKMFLGTARFFPLDRTNENVFVQASMFFRESQFIEDGAALRLGALRGHEAFGGDPHPNTVEDTDDVGGKTMGVSTGFRYWKNNLRIEGEGIYVHYDRNAGAQLSQNYHTLTLWAASLGASYFFPIGKADNNMGFEPLLKVSYTDIDDSEGDGSASGSTNPTGTMSDVQGQTVWEFVVGAKFHANKHIRFDFNWVMYDLSLTQGLDNTYSRNGGGGLMHAFVFQWVARW